jgi:hypothetical protein
MAIIAHIKKHKALVTIITPHLPSEPWFAKLLSMQASPSVLINHGEATFVKGTNPTLFPWNAMISWTFKL